MGEFALRSYITIADPTGFFRFNAKSAKPPQALQQYFLKPPVINNGTRKQLSRRKALYGRCSKNHQHQQKNPKAVKPPQALYPRVSSVKKTANGST